MSSQQLPSRHPYSRLAGSPQWTVIDRALLELAENRDLVETTAHDYIVGYLCKALADSPEGGNELESVAHMARADVLRGLREAVKSANPDHRDLVEELIAERRLEALRD